MVEFGLKSIVKLFEDGSVCVTGMKGTGKDVLFGNVIARRGCKYVSNLDYGGKFFPLKLSDLTVGYNTYDRFITDSLLSWKYPYPKSADIYISDVGVYLPSQHCNELNKKFPYLPVYIALSRQISRNNVHINTQNLNRCWDKLREQSDTYIRCRWCKFIGPIVFMGVTIYDKAESCQSRVSPCRISVPLFANREERLRADMYLDSFFNEHGDVKNKILVFINRSSHDTYVFEKKMGVTYIEDSL